MATDCYAGSCGTSCTADNGLSRLGVFGSASDQLWTIGVEPKVICVEPAAVSGATPILMFTS